MNLEANLGIFDSINAECCAIVWKWQVLTKRVEWSWGGSSFLWLENTGNTHSRSWYWNESWRWGRDCWWKVGVWTGGPHGLSASSLPSCTLGPDGGGFWQLVLAEQESVVRVWTSSPQPRSPFRPGSVTHSSWSCVSICTSLSAQCSYLMNRLPDKGDGHKALSKSSFLPSFKRMSKSGPRVPSSLGQQTVS